MKKFVITFFTIVILITIFNFKSSYAEPVIQQKNIQTTEIEVKANVPKDFTKTIYVNFALKDGTNALYTLTSKENYTYNGLIPVGEAKVQFINIVGNNDEYAYSSPNSLEAKDGTKATFVIEIIKAPASNDKKVENTIADSENPQKSKGNIGGNHTQEELEATRIDDKDSNEKEAGTNKEGNKNGENQEQYKEDKSTDQSANSFFKKYFLTILLFIIFGIAYLVIKIKKRYQ